MANYQYFLTLVGFLTIATLMLTMIEYNHQVKAKSIGYSINCSNDKCYTHTFNSTNSQSLPSSSPQSQNKVVGTRTVCINDAPCRTEPINSTNINLGNLLPFGLHK